MGFNSGFKGLIAILAIAYVPTEMTGT